MKTLFFILAGAVSFDPYILQVEFTDGTKTSLAATDSRACAAAKHALWAGLWFLDKPISKVRCEPGNLFGADYAKGIKDGR